MSVQAIITTLGPELSVYDASVTEARNSIILAASILQVTILFLQVAILFFMQPFWFTWSHFVLKVAHFDLQVDIFLEVAILF